jgi:hypothetical protein
VPLNERHGKVWHLGPLWFMSNAQIATLARLAVRVRAVRRVAEAEAAELEEGAQRQV